MFLGLRTLLGEREGKLLVSVTIGTIAFATRGLTAPGRVTIDPGSRWRTQAAIT